MTSDRLPHQVKHEILFDEVLMPWLLEWLMICSQVLASAQHGAPPLFPQVDAAARATHGSTSEAHLKHLSRTFPGCSLPNWVLTSR
jgi:hypothetical protein